MIAKRIRKERRQPRGPVNKLARRIDGLVAYVIDARDTELSGLARLRALSGYTLDLAEFGVEPGEKVFSYWSHNLPIGTPSEWSTQMLAAAALAVRSQDPVEHIVFSWRDDEHPNDEQVEDAADIILEVLGYGKCLAIGAAHVNTDKKHGHLAVVRVDLVTGKIAGDGWDIDRLHQAIAIVEERQGWAAEPNALYIARDGEVFCRVTGVLVRDRDGNQAKRARRSRAATPASLAPHIASIETALVRSASWAELHEGLEAVGVEYVAKGSGATIRVGDEVQKASALHPDLSRSRLEKRFGPFEANRGRGSPQHVQYQADGRAELARIRAQERAAAASLQVHVQAALGALASDAAARAIIKKIEVFIRAQLATIFGEAKACLKEQYLPYEEWKKAGEPHASFDIPLPAILFRTMPGVANATWSGAGGFIPRQHEHRCDYVDASGAVAFADYGLVVIVHDKRVATVDAALSLMAQGGGSVRVWGSEAFVRQCLGRASALGIDVIVDPSRVDAAKHTGPARGGPGATHAPGKIPVSDAKPALDGSLADRAPPAANAADQKAAGGPPTPKSVAPRSNAWTTSSQKENDNVKQTNRQPGLALIARVFDELYKPRFRANGSGAVARSSPRLRNLSIGDLVRSGGQDTSMLLSRPRRSELVSEINGDHRLRRPGHRLGLVEGEAGGSAARLSPGQGTTRGPAVGLAAGATMTDEFAIRYVAEKLTSATSPAPDAEQKKVDGNRSRAPVTERNKSRPGSTTSSRDASARDASVEGIWPDETTPQKPAATAPWSTIQEDDELRYQQLLQELKDRGSGR